MESDTVSYSRNPSGIEPGTVDTESRGATCSTPPCCRRWRKLGTDPSLCDTPCVDTGCKPPSARSGRARYSGNTGPAAAHFAASPDPPRPDAAFGHVPQSARSQESASPETAHQPPANDHAPFKWLLLCRDEPGTSRRYARWHV